MATPPKPLLEPQHTPIYIVSGVLAVGFVLGLVLPRGPNAGMIRTCIMLTMFNMWIFWVTVYTSQMNPLMGPKVPNTTLAWIAVTWGESAKPSLRSGNLTAFAIPTCREVPGGPKCPTTTPPVKLG